MNLDKKQRDQPSSKKKELAKQRCVYLNGLFILST